MKSLCIAALLALALSGCASPPPLNQLSTQQTVQSPPADQAQIVFLNPANSVTGAFLVGLYDIAGGERTLYGMSGPMSKIVQTVTPGKHRFMAHNTAGGISYLLDADVQAGKRYYVLLRFVYGRGLQLRPIKVDSSAEFSPQNPKFQEWVKDTKVVEPTAETPNWYAKYSSGVDKSQAAAIAEWEAKDASQKQQLTLSTTDFVAD
jgi:hypothetical protein